MSQSEKAFPSARRADWVRWGAGVSLICPAPPNPLVQCMFRRATGSGRLPEAVSAISSCRVSVLHNACPATPSDAALADQCAPPRAACGYAGRPCPGCPAEVRPITIVGAARRHRKKEDDPSHFPAGRASRLLSARSFFHRYISSTSRNAISAEPSLITLKHVPNSLPSITGDTVRIR